MKITKKDINELLEIYSKEGNGNKTETARVFCKRHNIEYERKHRLQVSRVMNAFDEEKFIKGEEKKFDVDFKNVKSDGNPAEPKKTTPQEGETFSMPSAWDKNLNRFLDIQEYCDRFNLDFNSLEKYNLVAHNHGHMVYNVRFKPTLNQVSGIDEEFIEGLVERLAKPIKIEVGNIEPTDYVDRLVITDVHIGMSTEGGRNIVPLYDGKWDKEELFRRLQLTVQHVVKHQKGDHLIIDELGDFMDGFDGKTTRKSNELPQNMNDKEAFEVGVEFKVALVEALLPYYNFIDCNSITSDNHAGVFGYFVNSTAKKIIEVKYGDKVCYNLLEKFINHYSIYEHTNVCTHGKEEESLKFGFKPMLDAKQAEKIDQYCKEHKLYNGNDITFCKGDSHQFIFDYTTSNDFNYFNYPAYSPPSNWVKTNFKNSKSGFVVEHLSKTTKERLISPYFF